MRGRARAADTGRVPPRPVSAAPLALALLAAGCRPAEPPEAVVRRHLGGTNPFAFYDGATRTTALAAPLDTVRGGRLMALIDPYTRHLRRLDVGAATVAGDTARVRVRLVAPRFFALAAATADDATGLHLARTAEAELDRGVERGPALRTSVAYADARRDSLFGARPDLRVDTTLDVVLVRTRAGWRVVRDYVTG